MYRRRTFLSIPAVGGVALAQSNSTTPVISPSYPTQDAEMVKEMVGVAHFNLKRVKELLALKPTLAKAAWDWGFGDWEMALGSASHVGNREIAETLLEAGAQPTIFSAAMLGQLEVVKAYLAAAPAMARTKGPHGITLLAHARAGGAAAKPVFDYLKTVEGSDDKPALQPLSDADKTKLAGAYVFGSGPNDRLEVAVNKGQMTIGRPGGSPRNINHLGNYAFYPVGAETVRIRFSFEEGKSRSLTIYDPGVVVTANAA